MITSLSNAKVKQIVALNSRARERRKNKLYIVEGIKMFEEACIDEIQEVFLLESCFHKKLTPALQEKVKSVAFEFVSEEVFGKISDTKTPQGILCVMKQPNYQLEMLLKQENPFFLVLEDIQDPGNLGTMIRTAEGAGITGVIMTKDTVDIYNSKTIRSTMGSIYRVPHIYIEETNTLFEKFDENKIKSFAAHLAGDVYFQGVSMLGGVALVIGNEGNGLSKEIVEKCTGLVKIPMEGSVESLNAAMAAGLLMYEVYRQKTVGRKI